SQLLRLVQLTTVLAPAESFPRELPITYVNLAGLELVTMPGEVSTAEGAAIRAALGYSGPGLGHGKIELIGLADEYSSYISTPSEYALQDYMGASTIWGPNEGPFFACSAASLKMNPHPATLHVNKLK